MSNANLNEATIEAVLIQQHLADLYRRQKLAIATENWRQLVQVNDAIDFRETELSEIEGSQLAAEHLFYLAVHGFEILSTETGFGVRDLVASEPNNVITMEMDLLALTRFAETHAAFSHAA